MKEWTLRRLSPLGTTLFANPVVVRDLRAQMRGTKSYWYQGAYLLLLGILAIAGYAMATGQGLDPVSGAAAQHVSIVDAQGKLEQLYYFIFMTLAILMCLIAPALTAASIVGERQRLSFDLLVTTPLRAAELLVGKLVSSIAFLGLLLVLSLPAAALCILFGGATLGDVFRVYLFLAIDGMVLAAIGLFFSCAAPTNLLAVVWSYISVAAYLLVTAVAFLFACPNPPHNQVGEPRALLAIGALNPITAIYPSVQQSYNVFGLHIPILIGTFVAAVLIIRLLVTASTYRLRFYGAGAASSLRRQVLLLSGFAAFVVTDGVLHSVSTSGDSDPFTGAGWGSAAAVGLIIAFLVVSAFLPALFVPVKGEDMPPGTGQDNQKPDRLQYRISRAMRPESAGALPMYHLWILVVAVGMVLSAVNTLGFTMTGAGMPFVLLGLAYVAGLGFLYWQIARFGALMVRTASGARTLSFGIFAMLSVAPLMALALSGIRVWDQSPIAPLYLFYPLLKLSSGVPISGLWYDEFTLSLWSSMGIAYVLGAVLLRVNMTVASRRSCTAVAPA